MFTAVICATLWLLDQRYPMRLPEDGYAQIVVDRDGQPLRAFPDANGVWRYPISSTEVSPYYLQALLTYEDRWFWKHPGVNPAAMLRALWQRATQGRWVSGGSTITMQVARLITPVKRDVSGKIVQMLRALQLEWHLSKTEILELYLNLAPFGGTVEGVQAASYAYLQKPAAQLTHAEAALLAVLPQRPSALRPDRHPARAQVARDKVLRRLRAFEVWSIADYEAALAEQVYASGLEPPMHAPLLARRLQRAHPEQRRIATTIDGTLQAALEDYVASQAAQLPQHSSIAVLVVENVSAEVRAYLGSAGFTSTERFGHVDMVPAQRSPGSTLKPFLYGLALDDGLIHSESLLADVPRSFGDYQPTNFTGGFAGPVSVSNALRRSLNVPAVELLSNYGSRRFAARLAAGGVPLALPEGSEPGLAVILGGTAVTLEDLVGGYLSLAREGRAANLRLQPDAELVERYLLSAGAAWITREILRDTPKPHAARGFAATRGGRELAWKTGTSYGFRDAWAIGVNGRYTIGVWVGRPDGTPSPGQFGRQTAAPMLFAIAAQLPAASTEFPPRPTSVSDHEVCWPLGGRVNEAPANGCDRRRHAWLLEEVAPPTLLHRSDGRLTAQPLTVLLGAATGLRVGAGCGVEKTRVQLVLWPQAMEPWLPAGWRREARLPASDPDCPPPTAPLAGRLRIDGLKPGDVYRPAPGDTELPTVSLRASGGAGARHWFVNGELVGRSGPAQALQYRFTAAGEQQLAVSDADGRIDVVGVRVERARRNLGARR